MKRGESRRSDEEVSVYNEFRYYRVLSLWPADEDCDEEEESPHHVWPLEEDSSELNQVLHDMEELDDHAAHRASVSGVLREHLAAFEAGKMTLADAYGSVRRFDGERWAFEPRDVVEWRGGDLRWRLGFIVESSTERHSVFSPSGLHTMSDFSDDPDAPAPRPSGKLIRALFGSVPFRWQQYALLEAERAMVHRRCSPFDFQNVEWTKWAEERWRAWERDVGNNALVSSQVPGARRALESCIFDPFVLIDQINNVWKFDPTKLTPYIYLACLGSGTVIALVCLTIQLGAAVALWQFHSEYDDEEEDRKYWADTEGLIPCRHHGDRGPVLGNVMICIVTLYYLVKVVPDMLSGAVTVTAWRQNRFSHVNSTNVVEVSGNQHLSALRRKIRVSDEDSVKMMLGLRIHETMNTAFDALLYLLNLYLLYGTNSVLEILLNCVAVEWIRGIDESFCTASWWDPNERYIKAAAVEMVIRQFLDLRAIETRWMQLKRSNLSHQKYPTPSDDDDDTGLRKNFAQQHSMGNVVDASEFVTTKLDGELQRFYGDDLKNTRTQLDVKGCTSLLFGRYKAHVFHRWERFLDGTIDWKRDTTCDFHVEDHARQLKRHIQRLRLVYGDVPGFPEADKYLTPETRYAYGTFLHKYPASANLIASALGLKLFRALRCKNTVSGFHMIPPHNATERRIRYVANVLDALVELGSLWVVISFPFCIVFALFYIPICY